MADDLWARFKVPEWGVFCHTESLRNSPARLKLVLSYTALNMVPDIFGKHIIFQP